MKYTGIYLDEEEKTLTMKDTCLYMFTVAVSIIVGNWKQPTSLPTDENIKKMCYIYKVKYFSSVQKNEICR